MVLSTLHRLPLTIRTDEPGLNVTKRTMIHGEHVKFSAKGDWRKKEFQ